MDYDDKVRYVTERLQMELRKLVSDNPKLELDNRLVLSVLMIDVSDNLDRNARNELACLVNRRKE